MYLYKLHTKNRKKWQNNYKKYACIILFFGFADDCPNRKHLFICLIIYLFLLFRISSQRVCEQVRDQIPPSWARSRQPDRRSTRSSWWAVAAWESPPSHCSSCTTSSSRTTSPPRPIAIGKRWGFLWSQVQGPQIRKVISEILM